MTGDYSTSITGTHKPSKNSHQTINGPSAMTAHLFCEFKHSEWPWMSVYAHSCKITLLMLHHPTYSQRGKMYKINTAILEESLKLDWMFLIHPVRHSGFLQTQSHIITKTKKNRLSKIHPSEGVWRN